MEGKGKVRIVDMGNGYSLVKFTIAMACTVILEGNLGSLMVKFIISKNGIGALTL